MLRFPGWKQAGRIEDERQLRCNIHERVQQRIEITGCGQTDADRIDGQRAVEVRDGAAVPIGELLQETIWRKTLIDLNFDHDATISTRKRALSSDTISLAALPQIDSTNQEGSRLGQVTQL